MSVIYHFIDYGIFLGYSVLLWHTLLSWGYLRQLTDKRKESLLTVLLLVMIISILAFVGANAYMLQNQGKTLLSIRMFQVFVIANFFVYWLVITLLRKEVADGTAA
jgi:hypothetical protein